MPSRKSNGRKIGLFGHFGAANFGNESTLEAMLCNIRRFVPDAEVICICTAPEIVARDYKIAAFPMEWVVVKPWNVRSRVIKFIRKAFVGIPSELYRCIKGINILRSTDVLIVVGTGLMTNAFGVLGWGPYSTFKWSLISKLSGCRLIFLSVGAGPVNGAGKFFVKSALSLADFRSYRDHATLKYLSSIGFPSNGDRVYPDLAFSLPPAALPVAPVSKGTRPVVGLGLMEYGGMYGIEKTTRAHYTAYFEALATFVKWVLDRGYDVRLLIGDRADMPAVREFRSLLATRLPTDMQGRVVDEDVESVEDLLSQIAATDLVVATRFHNVLLSLFLNKPSIAISFHHKCSSLMSEMGLSEYCQDIKQLSADKLIEQFQQLEANASELKQTIAAKAAECREALDEQYRVIFKEVCG